MKKNPYADIGDVIAEETSRERTRVRPTPKVMTDNYDRDDLSGGGLIAPTEGFLFGFHVVGDRRYE